MHVFNYQVAIEAGYMTKQRALRSVAAEMRHETSEFDEFATAPGYQPVPASLPVDSEDESMHEGTPSLSSSSSSKVRRSAASFTY